MNSAAKQKVLIIVLVSLAVIKWGILPVYEWQMSSLQQYQQQADFIAKSQSLLNNQTEYETQIARLDALNEEVGHQLFKKPSSLELDAQVQMQTLMEKHGLNFQSISFIGQEKTAEGFTSGYAKVDFESSLEQLIEFEVVLADPETTPKIFISKMSLNNGRYSPTIDYVRGSLFIHVFAVEMSD